MMSLPLCAVRRRRAPPRAAAAVRLLLDAHVTAGTAGVPVALDTHRAPVTLSRIAADRVLFR